MHPRPKVPRVAPLVRYPPRETSQGPVEVLRRQSPAVAHANIAAALTDASRGLSIDERRDVDKRVCDVCGDEFVPTRAEQKRCPKPKPCQVEGRRRNWRTGGQPGITDPATPETREVLELRSRLSLYEREWDDKFHWAVSRETKEHRGTLVAFLSDPHYGEVVDPREMGDYNAYNLEIADFRTRRFFERVALVSRDYLAGVTYDGIVLPLGGDIVSGDIHDELTETNEITTFETTEWVVPRLRAGIEMWLEEFGKVHVVSAPGNHGRNTKTPRHKKRSGNNADTHIARMLAVAMEGTPGLTFNIPRGMDASFEIYGRRFSLEHGDQAKGGDGQVGALGPVKRMTLRKTLQTSMEGRPFDYLLLGHFHQLVMAPSQGFVINGSLKGYDEYARAWHYKPEPPQQALMVVTPEHGVTIQTPILVGKRSQEGW